MTWCSSSILCCGRERDYYIPEEEWEEWAIKGPFEENSKKLQRGDPSPRGHTDAPSWMSSDWRDHHKPTTSSVVREKVIGHSHAREMKENNSNSHHKSSHRHHGSSQSSQEERVVVIETSNDATLHQATTTVETINENNEAVLTSTTVINTTGDASSVADNKEELELVKEAMELVEDITDEGMQIEIHDAISIGSSGSGDSVKIPPPLSSQAQASSVGYTGEGVSSRCADQNRLTPTPHAKAKAKTGSPAPHVHSASGPPSVAVEKGNAKAKAKHKAGAPKVRTAIQIVHNAKSAATSGLRTTDQSKMVEMLTAGEAKFFTMAANVIRTSINDAPTEVTRAREAAVLMFLLTYAAKLQHDGAKNIAATVISHISTHAAGEAALATKAAKEAAPQVVFYAAQFYKPLVEAIMDKKVSGKNWFEELASNAKFAMGSKPKFAEERMNWVTDFMNGKYHGATDTTSFDTYTHAYRSHPNLIGSMNDIFDNHRRGGSPDAIFQLFD